MEKLKKFEFPAFGAESTYDWEKLLDGGIYKLTSGEDFNCKPVTFGSLCRGQAGKRHKTVKISTVDEGNAVVMQATEMTGEQVDAWDAKIAARKAKKAESNGDSEDE